MRCNIVPIFNPQMTHVLMCVRAKDPFMGMYNFVGGRVEGDESDILAAYREVNEETGISPDDIDLIHFMNMYFAFQDRELIVFTGRLKHDVELVKEKNKLEWLDIKENFFDLKKFAGNGNIGLIMQEILLHQDQVFA